MTYQQLHIIHKAQTAELCSHQVFNRQMCNKKMF